MATMFRRVLGEDIELDIATAPDLDPVFVDPGQIEQVLLNLVVNARDAMPEGGRLSIATANVELDEAFVAGRRGVVPGPFVAMTVRDTGVGMSADTRAHIFEPLFTTKPPGAGTGLGLATVAAIVAESRGAVQVDSEAGRGASLAIYLPRHDALPSAAAPAPAAVAPARGTETILLVEDDEQVRDLARELLRGHGYDVHDAPNAEAALAIAAQVGRIHLLVTDVVMPRMSGRQLAERLHGERPELKVLFMSGHPVEIGAAFIQKPLTPDVLLAKVREVLEA
jgi:CheY-like chemotaxis protein